MDNIIEFRAKSKEIDGDLVSVSYTDNNNDLGIATLDRKIGIARVNDDDFIFITPDGEQYHDRAGLAEFLWVAATLLDSKQKHHPDVDLIGCDY